MSQSFDRPSGRSATTPSGTDSADGSGALGAWTSTYRVPKMDCPSEERMIRLALSGFEEVRTLAFDLSNRRLEVVHHGEADPITEKLATLGLGASLQGTIATDPETVEAAGSSTLSAEQESGSLRWLLCINALLFVVEMSAGLIAPSPGLHGSTLGHLSDEDRYETRLSAG